LDKPTPLTCPKLALTPARHFPCIKFCHTGMAAASKLDTKQPQQICSCTSSKQNQYNKHIYVYKQHAHTIQPCQAHKANAPGKTIELNLGIPLPCLITLCQCIRFRENTENCGFYHRVSRFDSLRTIVGITPLRVFYVRVYNGIYSYLRCNDR